MEEEDLQKAIAKMLGQMNVETESTFQDFMKMEEGDEFYREISVSDGKGYLMQIYVKRRAGGALQAVHFIEKEEAEGRMINAPPPIDFNDEVDFMSFLINLLAKEFERCPFITIRPMEMEAIQKKEKEATDYMYG